MCTIGRLPARVPECEECRDKKCADPKCCPEPSEMVRLRFFIDLLDGNGDIDETEDAVSGEMPRETALGVRESLERAWWMTTQKKWGSQGEKIPVLPMTESARLKAKKAIRRLRERDSDIMLDAVADNYARGRDDEREAIATYYAELFQRAPFSVADMLSDIRRNQHFKPGEP